MNVRLTEARRVLAGLQQGYAQSLRRVDQLLYGAVAQDPSCLDEAREMQHGYATVPAFTPVTLAPLEQPAARRADPPAVDAEPQAASEPAGGKVRKSRPAPADVSAEQSG